MEMKKYTLKNEVDQREYLRKLGSSGDPILGQVMNHFETREYLMTLDSLGSHFHYRKVYETKWVKDNMHRIGGGVSTAYVICVSS
jgi:hypothetical protein